MTHMTLMMPQSHIVAFEATLENFAITLVSKVEIPTTEIVEEPFFKVEILAEDYSMLYFIGYSIGATHTNNELTPILNRIYAQFMSMTGKVKELEYMQKIFEEYKKEKEGN